jgi:hypothetical protein
MEGYSYEDVLLNPKKRDEILALYDKAIRKAVKFGFIDTARVHAKNRKRFAEELSIFD